jgi:putative protease
LLNVISRKIRPDALIVQDLALLPLAKQVGFTGQIHLSTLANVSFPKALKLIKHSLGVHRIVLPRELNIDEIKSLAKACPPALGLELFVHGALCYAVSGRCYWSSYLGGKSGLRGRCVQPCRRRYRLENEKGRFFSCQDFSLDVLVKVLKTIPQIRAWKIEGRKKGPHYVYYSVQAYRMLRDQASDSQIKKSALQMLSRALGRTGTHYYFLPQRPQNPISTKGQTGSGLLVGTIKGSPQKPFLVTREALLPGDVLRLGYEDEPGHCLQRIGRAIPQGGRLHLKSASRKKITKGTPVFLTDRRENALTEMISRLDDQLTSKPLKPVSLASGKIKLPAGIRKKERAFELSVFRRANRQRRRDAVGLWLSSQAINDVSAADSKLVWWWLPPVVWPEEESRLGNMVGIVRKKGARNFVLNAPWQVAFFNSTVGCHFWAGPFCNLANVLALNRIKALGFSGAFVSPELGREDYMNLALRRPLPLGIVISGNWPLCISRAVAQDIKAGQPFTSPRGEQAWIARYGQDHWVFPNWKLDLIKQQQELQDAGFTLFAHLVEPTPKTVKLKKRPGMWNWRIGLK